MRRHRGTILIILYSISLISALWLLAGALNARFPGHEPSILFIPGVLLLSSLTMITRYAWSAITGMEQEVNDVQVAEGSRSPGLKKEKQSSRGENINIEAIARKFAREFDPEDGPESNGRKLLKILSGELEIMTGIYYSQAADGVFIPVSTFAFSSAREPAPFSPGEGLPGQAVMNRQVLLIREVPADYLQVYSGLGEAEPSYLAFIPFMKGEEVASLLECAGFRPAGNELEQLFLLISSSLSEKLSSENKMKTHE